MRQIILITTLIFLFKPYPVISAENSVKSPDTHSLKLLKNAYGWSIEYPGNWRWEELGGVPASRDKDPQMYGPIDKENRQEFVSIRVSPSLKNSKRSLQEQLEQSYGKIVNVSGGKSIVVDGKNAYEEIITWKKKDAKSSVVSTRVILIDNGKWRYKIGYTEVVSQGTSLQKDWKYEKQFEEIFSTFKLIDQSIAGLEAKIQSSSGLNKFLDELELVGLEIVRGVVSIFQHATTQTIESDQLLLIVN